MVITCLFYLPQKSDIFDRIRVRKLQSKAAAVVPSGTLTPVSLHREVRALNVRLEIANSFDNFGDYIRIYLLMGYQICYLTIAIFPDQMMAK